MKKFYSLLILFHSSLAAAQNTTVNATVVDSDGTTWANGTWSINFRPNTSFPNLNQYKLLNGASLNPTVAQQNGTLNSSGALAVTVYDSSLITPSGSGWSLTVCPNSSASCGIYNFSTSGASMNVSTNLTTTIPPPRFNAIAGAFGYADIEAIVTIPVGATYFNVTTQCQKTFQGGSWVCSSSGGTVSGQANGIIPLASGPNAITIQSHLDDGITDAGIITSKEPIAATALNGVYDLKAAFGASGSNQTMTCTATSGSSILTGCTGGDFKVGQTIFIPQAGISPTAVAPVGLTTTCGSDGTGSCTGSTTYCYEIATIQGAPNGTMSAPTAPSCITQGDQIPQRATNSTQPDVYTTVSWTAATNAALYAVYKSVNGGAYNFYTLVAYSAVTMNDYGVFAPKIMTCVDVGIPCTAPAGTTPNDVYATIFSISGGTVTLTGRTYIPVYVGGATGLSGAYPSQPAINGTVTVQHDDTPAFQTMHDFILGLPETGLKKVHIPTGQYNLHSEAKSAGWQHAITLAGFCNVLIEGDPCTLR